MSDKAPDIAAKLKYGTELHKKIVDALRGRLRMSELKMNQRYLQMAKNEELFAGYIHESDVDALRRDRRENLGEVDYRTIEIPYSYASLMAMHTYYTSVFLARSPILQVSGRHGEAEQKTQAVEALLDYQVNVGNILMTLFIWLLDPGKYGFSVLMHHWDTEYTRVRKRVAQPVTVLGLPIPDFKTGQPKTKMVETIEDVLSYEGNRAINVRPQDWFPDPRVALVHFQKGEFCGRYAEIPWAEINAGCKPIDGAQPRYFNYEKLKQIRANREQQTTGGLNTRDQGSSRVTQLPNELPGESGYDVPVGIVKSHEVYMRLQPSQWKLGVGDREEIWAFNVTTTGVIFGAEPLGEYHGKFPFDVLTDEMDGYTLFPRSSLERMKPLNDVMTWLINSHFYNVRSAMNNQLIVDPSMIVMKDLERPGPGKLIRLKPGAYGKDVRMAVQQLAVADMTRNHIGDMNVLMQVIQRMTGAIDPMMGVMEAGGRKTATEVRTSAGMGSNRLKTQCEWFSVTGWSPMTQRLIQRSQQFYDANRQYKLVGDLAMMSPQFMNVGPEDIAGFYDFVPVDGTLPIDRFAQANLWQMLMGQLRNYPSILMQYDISKIFAWVANLAGIKNIAQFRIQTDDQMMREVKAGNVVPLSQASRVIKDTTGKNMNEPGQVPGNGPSG